MIHDDENLCKEKKESKKRYTIKMKNFSLENEINGLMRF